MFELVRDGGNERYNSFYLDYVVRVSRPCNGRAEIGNGIKGMVIKQTEHIAFVIYAVRENICIKEIELLREFRAW
jgi:hypothetical protein